jgi:hypothetical protein
MAANLESLRDRWERMAPRERTLLVALGATLIVCLLAWAGVTIQRGLARIEDKNELSRDALRALAQYRAGIAERRSESPEVEIGDSAIDLANYMDEIVNQLQLKSPSYPRPVETARGAYKEVSIRISMLGLTIHELKDLLERVETRRPDVVVRDLQIRRDRREEEKLNLEMTVATYKKAGGDKGDD